MIPHFSTFNRILCCDEVWCHSGWHLGGFCGGYFSLIFNILKCCYLLSVNKKRFIAKWTVDCCFEAHPSIFCFTG